jgi:RNA polymerase sigma factor (sigma-70 family)
MWQAEQFERHRAHLQSVAYRMLGSVSEAEDAVQEAWLRLSRSEDDGIENLGGWLTTVVGRVCIDMLRSRQSRRESYVGTWLPEPIVGVEDPAGPEQEALLADSVGLALLVELLLEVTGSRRRTVARRNSSLVAPDGRLLRDRVGLSDEVACPRAKSLAEPLGRGGIVGGKHDEARHARPQLVDPLGR